MNDFDYAITLAQALDHYGIRAQVDMMIEEMAELTKALLKNRRDDVDKHFSVKNIREEIADVKIMLAQMEMVFDAPKNKKKYGPNVNEIVAFKVKRLAERIENND